MPNYFDAHIPGNSPAEVATLVIVAIAYFALALSIGVAAFRSLRRHQTWRQALQQPSSWVAPPLLVGSILRATYAIVLLTEPEEHGVAVDVVLIELPTFLWLAATSIVVLLWCVIVLLPRRRAFWYFFFAVNGFTLVAFVAFVVAFVVTPEPVRERCAKRLADTRDESRRRAVIVAYQGFVAGMALLLALVGSFAGLHLYVQLRQWSALVVHSRAVQEKQSQFRLLILAVTVALALLLHSAFLLVLGLLSPGIVELMAVLFVLEAAPAALLMGALQQPRRSTPSAGRSSGAGAASLSPAPRSSRSLIYSASAEAAL